MSSKWRGLVMAEYEVFQDMFESAADILEQFGAPAGALDGCEVLLARYSYENYSGDAFVVFRDADGALFEVVGGHCSCNGLEGQWEPTPLTLDALRLRKDPDSRVLVSRLDSDVATGCSVSGPYREALGATPEEKPRTTLAERLRALAAKETAAADAATVPMLFGLPMNKERSTHRAQAFNEAAALAEAEPAPAPTESTISGPEYRAICERAYGAEVERDAAHERINKWERAFRDVVLERDAARIERAEAVATAERLQAERTEEARRIRQLTNASCAELTTDAVARLARHNAKQQEELLRRPARGAAAERERLALVLTQAEHDADARRAALAKADNYMAANTQQEWVFALRYAAAECRRVPQ